MSVNLRRLLLLACTASALQIIGSDRDMKESRMKPEFEASSRSNAFGNINTCISRSSFPLVYFGVLLKYTRR